MNYQPTCEPGISQGVPPAHLAEPKLARATAIAAGRFVFSLTGLRDFLQAEEISVVSLVQHLDELPSQVSNHNPDLLFLDVFLPDDEVLALLSGISPRLLAPKIVLFVTNPPSDFVLSALKAGVSAIVLKGSPMCVSLRAMVDQVLRGGVFVDPRTLARLLDSIDWLSIHLLAHTRRALSRLSNEDLNLLRALGTGANLTAIAEECMLAPGTVRNRLSRIYRVLGVNNRAEAVTVFVRARAST